MEGTINKEEMDFFNRLAQTTIWDDFCVLGQMNSVRVPFVVNGIKNSGLISTWNDGKPLKNLKIIDVGCGVGFLSEAFAKLGADITGIDASVELLHLAEERLDKEQGIKNNIHYVCQPIEEFIKTNDAIYDAVVASEIIEHVNNQELFMKSCVELLKPGGSIFITTINKTWTSWLKAIIWYEYVWGFIPKGTHDWGKFISPEDLSRYLRKYNCETKLVKGSTYDSINRRWSWHANTSTFYLLHAVKN